MYKVVAHKDEEGRPTGLFVVVNARGTPVTKPLPIGAAKRIADEENAKVQQINEGEQRSDHDSVPKMRM